MVAIATFYRKTCRILTLSLMSSVVSSLTICALEKQTAQAEHQQHILVIHSYHDQLPWTQGLRQGIEQGFQEQVGEVMISHEFLDAKRLPALRHGQSFLEQLMLKYPEQSLDLLMVSDDPGLRLVLQHRAAYFSTLPIVYLGINKVEPEFLTTPNMTGVFEIHSVVDTVLGALEQTKSQTILVVNDSTETGKAHIANINQVKQHPQAPTEVIVINDIVDSQAQARLSGYSPNDPILLLGQLRQETSNGSLASFQKTAEALRTDLPNPLYAVSTTFLGHGVIGGKILDPEYHASQAVQLAKQVLLQGNTNGIEPITRAKARWLFDDRELNRFGIGPGELPQGSQVLYRQRSFYDQYEHLVWLTLGVFLLALVIILLLIEVIRRRAIEENFLRENEKRYRDLAEAGASVFWELNQEAKFVYISDETLALNHQFSRGHASQKDAAQEDDSKADGSTVHGHKSLVGQSIYAIVNRDETLDFNWAKFLQLFYRHQPIKDFIFRSHEGKDAVRIFQLSGKPMFDADHGFMGYRGIQREITQEYELADTLAYQATYDWLTGLVNRYEFNKRLQETIEACDHEKAHAVLCYIDLDQFKIINDTAGHLVGDQLLIDIAKILQSLSRTSDVLGRLGGDEFGLILKNCSLPEAQEICKSILSALQGHRFLWQRRQFSLGCSIGAVPISCQSGTVVDLLSRADLACYKAKELGRGRVYMDTPEEGGIDSDKNVMTHIANLNQYIEEGRFFLVRQKIQALSRAGHQGEHFEALIRFKGSDCSVMSPGQFIPAMERYGVISIVDRWVLETILTNVDNVSTDALISLNISGISLSDETFLSHTVRLLQQSHLPATCLCFEITETAAISHLAEAKKFIYTLKDLGAKFALDDFGSGLSSFGYLKTLPVDFLKIDGSLVRNMVREPSDLAIVKCVNEIAHMLGMQTIAEFVEDQQTLECLQALGVDYAQGYGIEKPKPLVKAAVSTGL